MAKQLASILRTRKGKGKIKITLILTSIIMYIDYTAN